MNQVTVTVNRRKQDGTQEAVVCPPLLVDYQKFMRGVDTKPLEHALRGRSKRDFLRFRLQLAEELITSFRSRKRAGRRISDEHEQAARLKPHHGHWQVQVTSKLDCVVSTIRQKRKLPRGEINTSRELGVVTAMWLFVYIKIVTVSKKKSYISSVLGLTFDF